MWKWMKITVFRLNILWIKNLFGEKNDEKKIQPNRTIWGFTVQLHETFWKISKNPSLDFF